MQKDLRQLLRRVDRLGWTIQQGGSHLKVIGPNGAFVTVPSTPSDWRAIRNCRAQLRRAGCPLP